MSKPIKPIDYYNFFFNDTIRPNHSAIEEKAYNKAFVIKAIKQTFYGPIYSKLNFTHTLFSPITAPIVLTFATVALALGVLGFAFKSLVDLCYKPKNASKTRVEACVNSMATSGLLIGLTLASAILTILSPLLALASLIGSSVASLSKLCVKNAGKPVELPSHTAPII